MKKLLFLSLFVLSLASCSSDDNNTAEVNAVAFASASLNLTAAETPVVINFAAPTSSAGSLTLSYTENAVVEGTDFSTVPAVAAKTIVVPFAQGVSSVSFTFKKLKEAVEGQVKNVVFTISSNSINAILGENKTIQVNFNETAYTGGTLAASVGGPNQPNQLYLDLSSGISTSVNRAAWDFGFYSGSDFRVIINGSVKMAVKKLETSDITLPQEIDSNVTVGAGTTAASNGFVDNPTGVLTGAGAGLGTAIAEISATDADNKVYLVNMGAAVSTKVAGTGGVEVDGDSRGWKKVRILRNGAGYKIQYAELGATTFTEKTISKDATYNFTFFSIASGNTVSVEPAKAKWDLNFTVFTNYLNMGSGDVTYGYADFITTNSRGGSKVYQVLVSTGGSYADFTKAKVVEDNFKVSETDQRIIGANWRNGGGPTTLPSIRTDRFYVVKDAAGNYYKVRFLTMLNEKSERGNVTLESAILK
ncbi:HmuY family protein [Flavobacterium sp. DG2-3]|uniref:HmuY family protein n=1 Tax=Flavobacterium sp. DG2-3 TaxID=3068317 RepID=UPI00273E2F9F|nr:HmuY family protein [Flavobacterium sp. DG2-3]MDP5201316.1 HmuY family protein [Flavobacterium sp. DG2-3]